MNTSHSLSTLWAGHLASKFPRAASNVELGGIDIAELAELDAFIAGYVSRVAEGLPLQPTETEALPRMSAELNTLVSALSGTAATYFQRLVAAANAALKCCRS